MERPIFQGLSQEALSMCMQSVTAAADAISERKVKNKSNTNFHSFEIISNLFLKSEFVVKIIYDSMTFFTDPYGW